MKCPKCHFENTGTSRYCSDCGTSLTKAASPPEPVETRTLPPFFELETGASFADRYQVIEKIGTGGMGRVYKVFDTKIRERVALKLIKPEIASDPKTIERFRNEIRLARRIAHKNVCRMYDMGESLGIFYITMEYVPGENLKNIIRLTGPLNPGTAVNYARQVCEGLAEAHRWNVVHRDLKPHNIIIDPSGTARIMDFGIARSLQTEGWTGEGIAIGTPEYMSPEQAEGKDVDRRSDLYSLGIILYEMITGKVPFEGDTTLSILRKQGTESPIPPREWNPQIPESLNRLILKCLEKKEERRYQDAGELLSELNTIGTTISRAQKTPSRATAPSLAPLRLSRLGRILGIGLTIIILAAVGYWIFRSVSPKVPLEKPESKLAEAGIPAKTPTKNSIAVLPFQILSLDANQAVLCKGLENDIRTKLSNLGTLTVMWEYSSGRFSDPVKDPVEIGKALNVEKILHGLVQIEKETIRVNINLIDAGSGSIIWAQQYEEKLGAGYLKVAGLISSDIARQLNIKFSESAWLASQKMETSHTDAYVFMHRGQNAQIKYRENQNVEDFYEAVNLYKRALDLDPNYWQAYWGLGNVYEARYVQTKQGGDPSAKENLTAMIKNFQDALAKNDTVAEVHVGMGWAYFHQGDFDKAYASFKKAVELDPNSSEANFGAGAFLRSIGLDAQAIKYYKRAIEYDPMNDEAYISAALCSMYYGNYEEAAGLMKQALAINPSQAQTHLHYARLLIMMKNYEDAEKELLWVEKNPPSSPSRQKRQKWLSAWLLAARGAREKALAMIQDADKFRYDITSTLSLLGMKKEAIQNIKLGNEQGFQLVQDYMYPYPFLISNPYFENLRQEKGFQEIVRNEKAKFEDKTKRYGDL